MKRVIVALLLCWSGTASAAKVAPLTQATCTALVSGANLSNNQTVARACQEHVTQAASYASDPFPGSGTIYYFCDCQAGADANCVAGSDSNACTSPSAPCQTVSKFASLYGAVASPGTVTTFAFCRGGEWAGGSGNLNNTNFNSTHTWKVRDYGPSQGMPWTPAVDWVPAMNQTAAGFALDFRGNPSPIDTGWGTVENIEVTGTTGGGIRISNGAHDVTVGNVVVDGVGSSFELDGNASYPANCYTAGATDSAAATSDTCLNPHDFHIFGSYALGKGNSTAGYIGAGSNLLIQGVVFQNTGTDAPADHAIYLNHNDVNITGLGTATYPVRNERILYSLFVDSGTGPSGTNKCDGVQIVSHDAHIGIEIGYSAIVQTLSQTVTGNCYCIQTNGGSAGTNFFLSTNIHDNLMWECGGTGIDLGSGRGDTVKNNLIVSTNVPAGPTKFLGFNYGGGNAGQLMSASGRDELVAANTIVTTNTTTQTTCLFFPTSASSGLVSKGNFCYMPTAVPAAQEFMWFQNGFGVLKGGLASYGGYLNIATYKAITNAQLHVTINGTSCLIAATDLSAATGMGPTASGIGGKMQAAIRACGGNATNATFEWMGGYVEGYWNIGTSNPGGTTPTTITVADCTGVTGTCVADGFGLSTAGGGVVTTLATSDRNLAFVLGAGFKWEAVSGFATPAAMAASGFAQDSHSVSADPKLVSTSASGLRPFAPGPFSPLISAGDAASAPATDIYGTTRTNPPDIGAIQRFVPPPILF